MKRYYICEEDSYRQRTGNILNVELEDNQIELDRFGNLHFDGNYLYEDYESALWAALS